MTNREEKENNIKIELKGTSTKEECVGKECKKCEHYLQCNAMVMGYNVRRWL